MNTIRPIALIVVMILLCQCRTSLRSELAIEADSLVKLTIEIQQRIASPEIQRLGEFRDEILQDLETMGDSAIRAVRDLKPGLLDAYAELNAEMEKCLHACSQFHEEAFMLESTLMEIRDRAGIQDADRTALKELLDAEWIAFSNLSERIDSNLEKVEQHSRVFYELKPRIDTLLSQKGQ